MIRWQIMRNSGDGNDMIGLNYSATHLMSLPYSKTELSIGSTTHRAIESFLHVTSMIIAISSFKTHSFA